VLGETPLLAAPPTLDASGALRLRLAPHRSGNASLSVAVYDDGGTEDGGVDYAAVNFQVCM
jgi:hypothetical protein